MHAKVGKWRRNKATSTFGAWSAPPLAEWVLPVVLAVGDGLVGGGDGAMRLRETRRRDK